MKLASKFWTRFENREFIEMKAFWKILSAWFIGMAWAGGQIEGGFLKSPQPLPEVVEVSDQGSVIKIMGVAGRSYRPEVSTSLTEWSPLGSEDEWIVGDGSEMYFEVSGQDQKVFVRFCMHDGTSDDYDSDGLSNDQETSLGTNLFHPDSDGDGMTDGWEVQYGLNPLVFEDSNADEDGDSLTNVEEFILGTNPLSADTDNDGEGDAVDETPSGNDYPLELTIQTTGRLTLTQMIGYDEDYKIIEGQEDSGLPDWKDHVSDLTLKRRSAQMASSVIAYVKKIKIDDPTIQTSGATSQSGDQSSSNSQDGLNEEIEILGVFRFEGDDLESQTIEDIAGEGEIPQTDAPGTMLEVYLAPVEIVVDSNRNGVVEFGKDRSSSDKPFNFWINYDKDTGDDSKAEDLNFLNAQISIDGGDDRIHCLRDLEDFAQMSLYLGSTADLIN